MPHHDIKLYNSLVVNSTQGMLFTISDLMFSKKVYLKGCSKKRAHCHCPPCSGGPAWSINKWYVLWKEDLFKVFICRFCSLTITVFARYDSRDSDFIFCSFNWNTTVNNFFRLFILLCVDHLFSSGSLWLLVQVLLLELDSCLQFLRLRLI